ncbi:hypothetical protein [Mycobacterium sp. OTB74]|jgi:hypothetical protein|uniref:hypothetical protein n=1 Tax=Mycobacterium sp. OTB74 TaxID=1853452 RepID=UPI002474AF13|nr:hypothetical protein [Mycobacterium sp. OTB74]MDH6242863.1 hypothetical protein [Mycobacterium sp. OTB74]
MEGQKSDPVDHARTTRKHAGESMKYGANGLGLILIAIGVVAVLVSLSTVAVGQSLVGGVAALVALIAFVAGAVWLGSMHRRVRVMQDRCCRASRRATGAADQLTARTQCADPKTGQSWRIQWCHPACQTCGLLVRMFVGPGAADCRSTVPKRRAERI